jgi:hypothetical protein
MGIIDQPNLEREMGWGGREENYLKCIRSTYIAMFLFRL